MINDIEARWAAATPGPWEWEVFDPQQMGLGQKGKVLETTILGTDRCKACADRGADCLWPNKANANAIASAPEDIAWLIQQLRDLREWKKRAVEAMPKELAYLYWSAYHAGHHDTVEAQYTDVLWSERYEYWADAVNECLDSCEMPALAAYKAKEGAK